MAKKIAFVASYGYLDIGRDTDIFCKTYHLPPCNIRIIGDIIEQSASWAKECAVDVQLAHYFSPQSEISLYLAPTDSAPSMIQTVESALLGDADVIGLCFGMPKKFATEEFCNVFRQTSKVVFASYGNGVASPLFPACEQHIQQVKASAFHIPSYIFRGTVFSPQGSSAYTASCVGLYAKKTPRPKSGCP